MICQDNTQSIITSGCEELPNSLSLVNTRVLFRNTATQNGCSTCSINPNTHKRHKRCRNSLGRAGSGMQMYFMGSRWGAVGKLGWQRCKLSGKWHLMFSPNDANSTKPYKKGELAKISKFALTTSHCEVVNVNQIGLFMEFFWIMQRKCAEICCLRRFV